MHAGVAIPLERLLADGLQRCLWEQRAEWDPAAGLHGSCCEHAACTGSATAGKSIEKTNLHLSPLKVAGKSHDISNW